MSTNDVPGAVEAHNDELAMGCWSEHADGSLILVESVEGNRVIYSMFDLAKDPIVEFRDAMPQSSFEKTFSWPNEIGEKWTWHDKTPFPWDRIIQRGATDGPRFASAGDLLSAADRVAQALNLHGERVARRRFRDMMPTETISRMRNKFARALGELRK